MNVCETTIVLLTSRLWWFIHIIPHNLLSDERMWDHPCCTHIPQVKNGYHRTRRVKDAVMSLWVVLVVVSQSTLCCWIVVFAWCNFLTILYRIPLYINDVTFDSIPWVIIWVMLDPSTLGDYSRPDFGPLKSRCDTIWTGPVVYQTEVPMASCQRSFDVVVFGLVRWRTGPLHCYKKSMSQPMANWRGGSGQSVRCAQDRSVTA
jgi:hypothetical protein